MKDIKKNSPPRENQRFGFSRGIVFASSVMLFRYGVLFLLGFCCDEFLSLKEPNGKLGIEKKLYKKYSAEYSESSEICFEKFLKHVPSDSKKRVFELWANAASLCSSESQIREHFMTFFPSPFHLQFALLFVNLSKLRGKEYINLELFLKAVEKSKELMLNALTPDDNQCRQRFLSLSILTQFSSLKMIKV